MTLADQATVERTTSEHARCTEDAQTHANQTAQNEHRTAELAGDIQQLQLRLQEQIGAAVAAAALASDRAAALAAAQQEVRWRLPNNAVVSITAAAADCSAPHLSHCCATPCATAYCCAGLPEQRPA